MTTLLEDLCSAGADLVAQGFSPGSSGNVSIRIESEIYISPTGTPLDSLTPDALSVLRMSGDQASHSRGPKPSKEFMLHAAMYQRDPSATCVVHLHSPYAVAASCLPPWAPHCALPPLTPYLFMRVGNLPLLPYRQPGDPRQADDLRELSIPCHGVLLQNHGLLMGGLSVDEAVSRTIEVESASETTLLVENHPGSRTLENSEINALIERYKQPWSTLEGE